MNHLTQSDIDQFNEEGYLIFEGLFGDDLNERIKADLDQLMIDRENRERPILMAYPELGALTSEPSVVDRVADLMDGKKFAHHHIHARWQLPGERGVAWHQDYAQIPQTNRSHLMVHVFMYLDGLNGEIGDLLVMPGTQKKVMAQDAFRQFEFEDLPGSVTVDSLASGSIIIVHSAVQHARRPKPGGGVYKRYFIDTSYCQEGILWPSYRNMDEINRIALEKGWDRDGKYAFLYDTSQFFDRNDYNESLEEKNQGSLALKLQ
jgi:hypothetical protein